MTIKQHNIASKQSGPPTQQNTHSLAFSTASRHSAIPRLRHTHTHIRTEDHMSPLHVLPLMLPNNTRNLLHCFLPIHNNHCSMKLSEHICRRKRQAMQTIKSICPLIQNNLTLKRFWFELTNFHSCQIQILRPTQQNTHTLAFPTVSRHSAIPRLRHTHTHSRSYVPTPRFAINERPIRQAPTQAHDYVLRQSCTIITTAACSHPRNKTTDSHNCIATRPYE